MWKRKWQDLEWRLRSYWAVSAMRMFIAIWGVIMMIAISMLLMEIPL